MNLGVKLLSLPSLAEGTPQAWCVCLSLDPFNVDIVAPIA